MRRQEIAATIKEQIGPNVLLELGAHNFVVCEQGLEFLVHRGWKYKIRIVLYADMYSVEYWQDTASDGWIIREELSEVFFFQLSEVLADLCFQQA